MTPHTAGQLSARARALAATEQLAAERSRQREQWSGGFTRRKFLAGAGMAAAAALGSQLVTTRYAYAVPGTGNGRALVLVFLRGGFDGLAAVVPAGDPDYAAARPGIGVPDSLLLPLDRRFGLHPALAPLHSYWGSRQLAFVHAVGGPHITRSHFQAMDQVERGVESGEARTGWLARALAESGPGTTFRATSESVSSPMSLAGSSGVVSLRGVDSIVLYRRTEKVLAALGELYTGLDLLATEQVPVALQLLGEATALQETRYKPAAQYPAGYFASAMSDVARLIKSGTGLRVATVDVGGWDIHSNAGPAQGGDMTDHLTELGATLAAFAADLGSRLGQVTVLTMSEFGRRVAENGSGGTDHGHGNAMMVLGGSVAGGSVYGGWPGLGPSALVDGDLAGVNDYRDVLFEVSKAQLGLGSIDPVFPSHRYSPLGLMH
ncbi:MAG: DUF1501 domain-containing protein [Geodermatophilaceae bacterium]|nr:DUF1501 domain-containing protein [Geodermatophilaceae bacterium]MDQ3464026.1 DUF1501 domain-containing protein [Actinomycetota bacterium]